MTRYICKGPVAGTITQEDIDASVAAVERGERDRPIPHDALGHTKRGLVKQVSAARGGVVLNEHGDVDITTPDVQETLAPCGQDMTVLIEAIPFDGLEYDVTCPRCGNVMSVRRAADAGG